MYLRSVSSQLSCLFNHAVKYYGLPANPVKKAGHMGTKKSREMLFWTRKEYEKFSEAIMDKPLAYYAFEINYIRFWKKEIPLSPKKLLRKSFVKEYFPVVPHLFT